MPLAITLGSAASIALLVVAISFAVSTVAGLIMAIAIWFWR